MFSQVCRTVSIVLSSLLALSPVLAAQQADPGVAPVPPQILHAHTVFVANRGGSNYFQIFGGGPDRAYNTFYKELKRTGQYELVSSPAQADLIFEIHAIAPEVSDPRDTATYNPQVILTIRDPKTNVALWTESANVRAIGTKQRRDRQFDQSVAVLVDKLAQVTGQPLTGAQTKAIAANSSMPTAQKVFIVASIAGAAAFAAWVIHKANNPPTLTPPSAPALP